MRQLIRLRTYRYTFKTAAACDNARQRLQSQGAITMLPIDNGYGFELEVDRQLYEQGWGFNNDDEEED